MSKPRIVVENDVFTRLLEVILDPDCSSEKRRAFADFFAHDLPDFDGWIAQLRARNPALFPADVVYIDSVEQLHGALPAADFVVTESLPFGAAELALAPRLKAVQKYGFVVRNIDVQACAQRQVAVLTLRRRANIACAEQAMMMMLALAKRLPEVNKRTTVSRLEAAGFKPAMFDRRYTPGSNWARVGGISMLYDATLGIIGLGEIGRELAGRAKAFGMRVIYTQRTRLEPEVESALGVEFRELHTLLAESDWIVPQLPATAATHHLLDKAAFDHVKPGAMLVNVSRAQVMERAAVLDALRSGRLAGFALDTLWQEPGEDDDELLAFPNVILTPHTAGSPRHNAAADFGDLLAGMHRVLNGHDQTVLQEGRT
jgi:phosphoglycerate dehydrogenase-like enzyme